MNFIGNLWRLVASEALVGAEAILQKTCSTCSKAHSGKFDECDNCWDAPPPDFKQRTLGPSPVIPKGDPLCACGKPALGDFREEDPIECVECFIKRKGFNACKKCQVVIEANKVHCPDCIDKVIKSKNEVEYKRCPCGAIIQKHYDLCVACELVAFKLDGKARVELLSWCRAKNPIIWIANIPENDPLQKFTFISCESFLSNDTSIRFRFKNREIGCHFLEIRVAKSFIKELIDSDYKGGIAFKLLDASLIPPVVKEETNGQETQIQTT